MKIEKNNYQGYIWMSDAQKAIVIDGEFCLEITDDALPFVMEGMLATKDKSIIVKYVDGRHLYKEFDLNCSSEYDEEVYTANRMEGIGGLVFRRYWKEQTDSRCLDMKVLTPAEQVFVGFKKLRNND